MNLNIIDWTDAYLRYKDTIQRKIQKLEKNEKTNEIICELKDGRTQKYICINDIDEIDIKQIDDVLISCLNTKKNLNTLIQNWQDVKEKNVTFIFANPKKAAHWSINPKMHDRINDKTSIKTGLKALFESIPEI